MPNKSHFLAVIITADEDGGHEEVVHQVWRGWREEEVHQAIVEDYEKKGITPYISIYTMAGLLDLCRRLEVKGEVVHITP